MSLENLRGLGPECPSDFALDRLRGGEFSTEDAALMQGHVEGCECCTGRLDAMRAGFDREPGVDPRKLLAGARRRAAEMEEAATPWWKRLSLLVPAFGVGALALALLVWPQTPIPGPGEGLRIKGGLGLEVLRQGASGSESVISGASFGAGDRLRFEVSLPKAGHVAIVGVEQSGAIYAVWPLEQQKADLAAGKGQLLPGAFELDDSKGKETLHLVLCPEAPRCEASKEGLRCQAGCETTPFVMNKAP